jgi:ATP-dependent protease Clp ATPase subunit
MSDARCSWCDKTGAEVAVLMQGTGGAYICDECAELCAEVARNKKAGRVPQIMSGVPASIQEALRRLRELP